MANTSTSINVTSVDAGGNKLQKAITDINPNADADKLVGFAQKLNALTDNTYSNTVKITKQELDTTTPKTQTTISVSGDSHNPISAATIIENGFEAVNYNCNNHTGFVVVTYNDTVFAVVVARDATKDFDSVGICIAPFPSEVIDEMISPSQTYYVNGDTSKHLSMTGTIKFYVEESDTHTRSEEMTITINA